MKDERTLEYAQELIEQLKEEWTKAILSGDGEKDVIPLLQETVRDWTPKEMSDEVGHVLTVGDGIATVAGLDGVCYGEILIFNAGIRGMVQDLKRGYFGCILFGDDQEITEGSNVRRTGKTAGIPVGQEYLGRVCDALGNVIDG